jgi:hypothetical protein
MAEARLQGGQSCKSGLGVSNRNQPRAKARSMPQTWPGNLSRKTRFTATTGCSRAATAPPKRSAPRIQSGPQGNPLGQAQAEAGSMSDHFRKDLSGGQIALRVLFSMSILLSDTPDNLKRGQPIGPHLIVQPKWAEDRLRIRPITHGQGRLFPRHCRAVSIVSHVHVMPPQQRWHVNCFISCSSRSSHFG